MHPLSKWQEKPYNDFAERYQIDYKEILYVHKKISF